MYKIIKILSSEVIIGNSEDNSLKRVPVENSYEGAMVGDEVEVFSEGTTHYISKKEVKKNTNLFSAIQEKKTSSESSTPPSSLSRMVERMIDLCKIKQTYIGVAVYLGILLVGSFLLSTYLNSSIKDLNSSISIFSFGPLLVLGVILMGGINIAFTDSGLIGGSLGFGMDVEGGVGVSLPIILASVIFVGAAILILKRFIKSQDAHITKKGMFERILTTAILGQLISGILLTFYSQNMTSFAKITVNVIPLFLAGTLFVIIMSFLFGTDKSIEIDLDENIVYSLRIFKQKLVIYVLLGLCTSFIYFAMTSWDMIILAGNYALWFVTITFGGQMVDVPAEMANSAAFLTDFSSINVFIYLMMVINLFVFVVDLDVIQAKFAKVNKYTFAVGYSVMTVIVCALLVSLSTINISGDILGFGTGFAIGVDYSSLIMVFIITAALSCLRVSLIQPVKVLDSAKQVYAKILDFLHI